MIKKRILIPIIALVLFVSGYLLLRAAYVPPVLMYHYVKENDLESKMVVTPENFKRQMYFLKKHKYNVVSLEELVGLIKSKKRIPGKTVCITFDDGYEDNYLNAFPVLKELGFPATIFMMTDNINRGGCLKTWQIKEMVDNNITIGSHTKSDFWLGGNDLKKARAEIYGSKAVLERVTSGKTNFFSYPLGGFTKATRQMVIDAGYKGAVATNPGRDYPADDIYALKRVRISRSSNSMFVFWVETSGLYVWIKEHRDEQ